LAPLTSDATLLVENGGSDVAKLAVTSVAAPRAVARR
jgi:hypothetical protein